jgi:galactose mutarotase-like enzyme
MARYAGCMDIHRLRQNGCEARIASAGAELQFLHLGGTDLLWTAGPLWPRHAPLLFPIVGGLKDDTLHHRGTAFVLPKHGFARNRAFAWLSRSDTACALALRDDAETRASYPFPFRLTVSYALTAAGLRLELTLHNPGPEPLPASLGLHPAFRWPLATGFSKASHRLVFEADEPGPLWRLDAAGLLAPGRHSTPIHDRVLELDEALFVQDALIFLEPRSRGVRFEAQGGPVLALQWEGFPHLGIWTKPDPSPAFLCIEPWDGYASPTDWDGEFSEKPGSFLLAPGATRKWSLAVTAEIR